MPDVIVVGAGHNGLVAACYLARAGFDVLALEQAGKPGGGARTDETVPGYRFDTHSVAHNIINMTDIPSELALHETGLDYIEMDPFATALFADGQIIRFHRDIERTVESIRAVAPADAEPYHRLMRDALPVIRMAVAGIDVGGAAARQARMLPGRAVALVRSLIRYGGPSGLVTVLLQPYERLLRERLRTDRTRAPISAFAAHASASPSAQGGAFFALWQAAYHRYGQWHARGGAQGLTDALVRRLDRLGGQLRTGAPVARILAPSGQVRGVELEGGERIPAAAVVTAIEPRAALLGLLDPPLSGPAAHGLRAAHSGNAVQMLVHVASDRLPAYPNAQPGDHAGLQSYVDTLDAMVAGFAAAQARRLPDDPVPTYAFTTSALDDTLAPPGCHTVYLACPSAPFEVKGGWAAQAEGFAERMIDTVEKRAPGFRGSIQGMSIRTPEQMARELRWPGAHPMHLDITLDQLGWMRPTKALGGHATPVRGLFISGAGTAPVGGIAGAPGRAAANALLARHGTPRR
ncbi:MAG: phytoene desaturase family protein [Egibacteraceae bacterium]